jgi:hypothetical protein
MAKVGIATKSGKKIVNNPTHRKTSIGRSVNTHPKNKHKRKNFKKYRGQGVR